tara:strand:- start:9779 stop:10651 length:873 start_codon:yes stop_codon:yes gene_type:complete
MGNYSNTDVGYVADIDTTAVGSEDMLTAQLSGFSEINERTTIQFSALQALSSDNVTISNNVINTATFAGGTSAGLAGASTYGFNAIKLSDGVNDEQDLALFLARLTDSNGIGFLVFKNENLVPTDSTYTTQNVKTFAITSTFAEPGFNDDFGATTGGGTYANSLAPFEYSTAEGNALVDKFSYDPTAPIEVKEFALERLTSFASLIADDLRTGVLSRIDVVKTTRQLDITPETFETVTSDEVSEGEISITGRARSTGLATGGSGANSAPTSGPIGGGTSAPTSGPIGGSY